MQLTHENYHTLENRYLTRSRIGDFKKCPHYFYERHIAGIKNQAQKDCFRTGSAVDIWLTKGKDEFMQTVTQPARRNLKNPPPGIIELTPAQFEDVVAMCEVIEKQPAFHDLKNHKAQRIIQADMPVGDHFVGLAAMPDWYHITEDNVCIITDLKTAQDAEPSKYHYKCKDFGYYDQFALEKIIFKMNHPEIVRFDYRHLIITKDADVKVPFAYYIDDECVEDSADKLKNKHIPIIAAENDFNPKMVTWEKAPTVGMPDKLK